MMTERTVDVPTWAQLEAEVYAGMGYGTQRPEAEMCDIMHRVYDTVAQKANPRVMYTILPASLDEHRRLKVAGVDFNPGGIITSYLPGMTHVCLFVASAGVEYDDHVRLYKEQGDILSEYIADAIGSALVEHCVSQLSLWLSEQCPMPHSLGYSPGYCGWNIREQQLLFSLFPPKPCGVRLSDSCLMWPIKSVSGFIAMGHDLTPQPYRCEICTNKRCYKRKKQS